MTDLETITTAIADLKEIALALVTKSGKTDQQIASLIEAQNQTNQRLEQLTLSVESLTEAQRSMLTSLDRMTNTFETLSTQVAEDKAEIRRIWEYLLTQSGNGHRGNN